MLLASQNLIRNKVMMPPSRTGLSTIDEVIADAKAGKLFILVDDEDRENEGDLCVIGEYATAESINFMAKYGRGLICLALTRLRTEQLGLTMMERRNESGMKLHLPFRLKPVKVLPREFLRLIVH